jgi:hypothetical protein
MRITGEVAERLTGPVTRVQTVRRVTNCPNYPSTLELAKLPPISGNDLPAFLPVYNLHESAPPKSQRAIWQEFEDAAIYGVCESEQIRLVLSD